MNNLLVTVSGGRSSAMMARHIQTSEKYSEYNKIYVFANTGMERPETIDFLKNIEKYWGIDLVKVEGVFPLKLGEGVTHKIVDWDNLDMKALPFEQCVEKYNLGNFEGLPDITSPYCSGRLKTMPCDSIAKEIFGKEFIKVVGFRKEDMPKRISWAEIREDKRRIFPLLTDFGNAISQFDLNVWWEKQPFKLEIHGKYGNCDLCWKKSLPNLLDNIRKGSPHIEWWRKMEKKYGNTSFIKHLSIDDLVRMAQEPFTHELNFDEEEGDIQCVCNF